MYILFITLYIVCNIYMVYTILPALACMLSYHQGQSPLHAPSGYACYSTSLVLHLRACNCASAARPAAYIIPLRFLMRFDDALADKQ